MVASQGSGQTTRNQPTNTKPSKTQATLSQSADTQKAQSTKPQAQSLGRGLPPQQAQSTKAQSTKAEAQSLGAELPPQQAIKTEPETEVVVASDGDAPTNRNSWESMEIDSTTAADSTTTSTKSTTVILKVRGSSPNNCDEEGSCDSIKDVERDCGTKCSRGADTEDENGGCSSYDDNLISSIDDEERVTVTESKRDSLEDGTCGLVAKGEDISRGIDDSPVKSEEENHAGVNGDSSSKRDLPRLLFLLNLVKGIRKSKIFS